MGILLAKKATLSGEELEVNIKSNFDINATWRIGVSISKWNFYTDYV